MNWFTTLITVTACINFLLLIVMVFLERRKLQTIIAWLTVLTFLPIFGFLLYIIFGSGLSIRTRRMIRKKAISESDILKNIENIDSLANAKVEGIARDEMSSINLCMKYGSYPLPGNDIQIYCNGLEKMQALKEDILNAKNSINLEYYIFEDDLTGKEFLNLLCQKAREGVEVRLIYDSIGSRKAPRRFFNKLKKAGGQVAEFFPPFMHIRLINLKLNYRNHRKIAVIDGRIGYTGGINIRDDHMGLDKKLRPWRDTHIRIEGSGVYALQNIFLDDWRYAKKEYCKPIEYIEKGYFPAPKICGDALVQVIASGPDSSVQKIKEAYVKLITNAKKRVYIQTPYFIPDDVFFSALRIAVASGVDVRIMVPRKPDKRTVYLATLSYLKEMADMGIRVFLYDGFLHSKAIVIDDMVSTIGSANMDERSYNQNFEINAFIYDKQTAETLKQAFLKDMDHCSEITLDAWRARSRWERFKESIARLFSPLM